MRAGAPIAMAQSTTGRTILPGVVRQHPNDNVETLKSQTWSDIVQLLGEDGESIMSSMLLDCGLFVRLKGGKDNYYQLSGIPLTQMEHVGKKTGKKHHPVASDRGQHVTQPSAIRFVRNRIFYARPALSANGNVKFGLKHVHVLERFPEANRFEDTVQVMKYIFPRQFGLHNVFTSTVDSADTAQQFKDYTFREQGIQSLKKSSTWLPRRLRGDAAKLVQSIQRNHKSCSYSQLLRHYCPVSAISGNHVANGFASGDQHYLPNTEQLITQFNAPTTHSTNSLQPTEVSSEDRSFLPYSTPVSLVSAFCRSVLRHLLPGNAFGKAAAGERNWAVFMKNVDIFVQMRRFETWSIHQACQGISSSPIEWLDTRKGRNNHRMSRSDI
jgi:telomerase reverse transcriptase